jgi:enamine deaminase RidA (YjgF/YER057c/UK114 family)
MEGAQVALESISMDKKAVNPQGLAFISGQQTVAEQPTSEMAPLIQTSLAGLKTAVASLSVPKDEVLQVTCFATSLSDYTKVSRAVTEEFPRAVTVIVQPQRLPGRSLTECEAVARLGQPVGAPVKMVNPSGMTKSEAYSQIALIGAERVALSGTQLAFRLQEEDARLAFQRLDRSLEGVKTSLKRAAVGHFYALSQKSIEMIRSVRFDYLDKDRPPASTLLLFEGLPSLDASFGLDVIAIVD